MRATSSAKRHAASALGEKSVATRIRLNITAPQTRSDPVARKSRGGPSDAAGGTLRE